MSKNVFHHMPHVCDLLFVIEKYFHDRFHVVCWTSLIDLLPVNKEMCGLHVDGERKVRCIFDSGDEAGVGKELMEIANNHSAVTRTLGQGLGGRSVAQDGLRYHTLRACLEVCLVVLGTLPLGAHEGKVKCRSDCTAEQAIFLLHREGGHRAIAVLPVAVAK